MPARASPRTWRCAPTRRGCWAATRCWCCTAAATPRSRREMADLLGETHEVLCVKGSGWDMGTIEPAGLPAVKLGRCGSCAAWRSSTDEDMVNFQRVNLLDARAPNPSVETLLHAFLPHKFIDHTHAAAVLSLVDQPNGEELVAEVYDGTMGLRALRHPRLRPRQAGGAGLRGQARRGRADPAQARHLHLRRRRARGLRAHDRARVAGRGAAGQGPAQRVRAGRPARRRWRIGGARWRRSCAAPWR